jgi:hypothetical protein
LHQHTKYLRWSDPDWQRDFGFAEIDMLGDIAQARMIFGKPESEPLLGASVLKEAPRLFPCSC